MRFFTALVFLMGLAWACVSESDIDQSTPKAAAQGFFTALSSGDYDLAKRYGTASTSESVQHFATNLKMVSEAEQQELQAPFQVEIEQINCIEQQGNTTCTILYKNQQEVRADLVQQNEQWLVQMELNF